MPGPESHRDHEELRAEALAAARGLTQGEQGLVAVLRDLEQEKSRAAEAYEAVIRSLAAALEARDGYTGEHSDAVHQLSAAVARRLGLDRHAVGEVQAVAILHDVGKIGIPDQVLHKRGPLDSGEWVLMRRHPIIGERILRPLPGLSAVATAVRHEHERWDGHGYPDGLAGEDIPLASRIVLACDAYHALVSDRPYRAAMSEEDACAELRRCAGTQFDPRVVAALLDCLGAAEEPAAAGDAPDVATLLADRVRHGEDGRVERELRALISIASAVAGAQRLEDVIEVAAEEARAGIDAATVSVSRWEGHGDVLRTLINVGDLGPGEERLPAAEVYRLDTQDPLRCQLEEGDVYIANVDDASTDPLEIRLLSGLEKHCCVCAPIHLGGRRWGELWATRRADQPCLTEREARFLQTVSGQIAAAIGRSELFARMLELAFEDPLTGLANRRALDERLERAVPEALREGRDLAVLLCDVDKLKELNDVHGHHAGDDALRRVGAVLREAAAAAPGEALVCRLGGDEFCVVLEGAGAGAAQRLGEDLLDRLAGAAGPALAVSCGIASLGQGAQRPADLVRAADAAQYTAKRTGRARVCVADPRSSDRWEWRRTSRRHVATAAADAPAADVKALLSMTLDELDGPLARRPTLERLESVLLRAGEVLDASAAAVSYVVRGGALLDTVFDVDLRTGYSAGSRFGWTGKSYAVADYPATERLLAGGGSFIVWRDDPEADPAERALLDSWGLTAVLAAAGADDRGAWLVEIYADERTAALDQAEPALRLLVAEAVRGAAGEPPLRAVG
jgi:diguanylate cyclase (GGDEF)-like protein